MSKSGSSRGGALTPGRSGTGAASEEALGAESTGGGRGRRLRGSSLLGMAGLGIAGEKNQAGEKKRGQTATHAHAHVTRSTPGGNPADPPQKMLDAHACPLVLSRASPLFMVRGRVARSQKESMVRNTQLPGWESIRIIAQMWKSLRKEAQACGTMRM
jgi:hypothetical protein